MNYKGDNQAFFIESVEEKLEIVNAIEIVCGKLE